MYSGAYHLELVADLTTNAFLNAFDNFLATRGVISSVRSDNATTFHRASKLIRKAEINQQSEAEKFFENALTDGINAIQEKCARKNIQWLYNAPLNSNAGRRHERAVRSVQEKLRACIGTHKLTFPDMFSTMLNSRPLLKARYIHEEEPFVLTPGHFTTGKNITALPTVSFLTPIVSKREAYLARETIESQFWSYFYKNYINELKNRTKWYLPQRGFQAGDLCILKDDNAPPLEWRKGLVIKVFPGVDNIVRVVVVRTAYGTFTRPTNKLVLIPGGCESDDNEEDLEHQIAAPPNTPEPVEEAEAMMNGQSTPLPTIDEEEKMDLPLSDPLEQDPLQDGKVSTTSDWNHMMYEEETAEPVQPAAAPGTPPTAPTGPRRSRRIAARVPLFLAMLFLILHAVYGQVRVSSELGGGLMVYEVETVLLDRGTFHVDLYTGRKHRNDASSTIQQLFKLMSFCRQLKDTGTSCAASRYEIKQKALQAIGMMADITNEDLTDKLETVNNIDFPKNEPGFVRRKRELKLQGRNPELEIQKRNPEQKYREARSPKGWIWKTLSYLFSLEHDSADSSWHADTSSGVIVHAAMETKKMGEELLKHEQFLQTEYIMLKRELDYKKKLGTAMDKNAVESQVHRATSSFDKYIDRLVEPYINHDISHDELMKVLRKVNDEVSEGHARVPQISPEQLKKITTKERLYNGSLVIRLAVPLVEFEEFHTVLTVPFPDKETQSILEASTREVTVRNISFLSICSQCVALATVISNKSEKKVLMIHREMKHNWIIKLYVSSRIDESDLISAGSNREGMLLSLRTCSYAWSVRNPIVYTGRRRNDRKIYDRVN